MTPALKNQMHEEFQLLLKKYRGLSRLETEIAPVEELVPVSGILMAHEFDSWRAMTIGT